MSFFKIHIVCNLFLKKGTEKKYFCLLLKVICSRTPITERMICFGFMADPSENTEGKGQK